MIEIQNKSDLSTQVDIWTQIYVYAELSATLIRDYLGNIQRL